jgi:hypothetical protein
LLDFLLAFLAMTLIALLAIPCCFRLNRHAGAELTGRRSWAPIYRKSTIIDKK